MKIKIVHAATRPSGGVSVRVRLTEGDHSQSVSLAVDEMQAARLELGAGMELDREQYERLELAAQRYEITARGLELLSYGANSRRGLLTKLVHRGYDRELCADVVDELFQRGLVNETADAEGIIRTCLARGYGRRRIIMKLRERGYENETVSLAFEAFEGVDYTANCAEMIRKKYKCIPTERRELDRLVAAMVRYGYSYGEIKGALEICNS